ncbi:MAG: carbohydrate kinase family protein, partial [Lachnospiraceae bacterium]|nr:carbohydrate kinase family protein [Lachnospiraceae bacterium]
LICEATSSLKCRKIISVLHNTYILKANFIEACTIAKCECDVSYSRLLDSILYKGVKKTYITLGREGALYADDNLKLHVKPKMIVETNDTVGAGDAFTVGIMYGEREGWTCEEILVFSINLSFCYLTSGEYKLNEKILLQALSMRGHNAEVFYWDEVNCKWKEKVK